MTHVCNGRCEGKSGGRKRSEIGYCSCCGRGVPMNELLIRQSGKYAHACCGQNIKFRTGEATPNHGGFERLTRLEEMVKSDTW